MRRRIVSAAAACLVALAATLAVPAQASAAGPIKITGVKYDPPGRDTGSNTSLRAEWVRIKNTGNRAVSLSGWRVRDRAGHVYVFGTYRLPAGERVYVHTGRGSDTAHHKYWDRDWYVWNNTGDTATLKNRSLTVIDRCKWGNGDGFRRC
ncbi:MAG: lamin tail domain-containing protein [Streptosporangiales bacterium]|nr:lamin tail domain-containing protein [Streptosporangiales bacterium]